MANKVASLSKPGAGSAQHPTKTLGIPAFRNVKIQLQTGASGPPPTEPLPVEGQAFPRNRS